MNRRMTRVSVSQRGGGRRGFSIIEVVISMLIIGGLMVAAMGAVGAAAATDRLTMDTARACLLAEELLTEILLKAYSEPDGASGLGKDSGEASGGTRALFDDVDDFDGWVETPVRQADGTAVPGTTGWERRVEVVWVSASDPAKQSPTETGVKRITVEVRRDGRPLARLTALRTRAWPLPPHEP